MRLNLKTAADLHSSDIRRNDGVNDGVKYSLNKTEEKAMKAILREPHVSAATLAKLIGVKQRQAERVMSSLKRKAGLKRRGSDRRGEWYFAGM